MSAKRVLQVTLAPASRHTAAARSRGHPRLRRTPARAQASLGKWQRKAQAPEKEDAEQVGRIGQGGARGHGDRSKASPAGSKVESSCSHWRRATADAAAPCHPRTKVEGPSSCKVGAGTPSQSSRQAEFGAYYNNSAKTRHVRNRSLKVTEESLRRRRQELTEDRQAIRPTRPIRRDRSLSS